MRRSTARSCRSCPARSPTRSTSHSGVFLYNLAGDNRLSPTFNIFLVKVGSSVYKLQVVSYYSTTGDAGHPTIRYEKIQ